MSPPRILVVDDEPDIRELVRDILEDEGYNVAVAADAADARVARDKHHPDLALLDIWMPGTDGITLLKEWQSASPPFFPVIMMSGHGTIETAVEATRLGALDFIEKPLSLAKLLLTVRGALAASGEAARGGRGSAAPPARPELAGSSRKLADLRDRLRRLSASTVPVLIRGETGSGRHTAAGLIHYQSARADGPLVEFDVGAFGLDSIAAALFGPGGAWRAATGGSLVLHDIAELGAQHQSELARHLGESARDGPRLIALTGESLELQVQRGAFRADLLHALTASVSIPPLRDHAEDVPDLLGYFADRLVEHEGLPYRRFSVAAQNRLRNHEWPGNVTELRGLVRRLLVLGDATDIGPEAVDLALAELRAPLPPSTAMPLRLDLPLREAREAFERAYLEHQLRAVGGRIGDLARRVGMERTHLYRKLKSLGIQHGRGGS